MIDQSYLLCHQEENINLYICFSFTDTLLISEVWTYNEGAKEWKYSNHCCLQGVNQSANPEPSVRSNGQINHLE